MAKLWELAEGVFDQRNEGWIDPNSLRLGFRKKAQNQGAKFETAKASAIRQAGKRITSVTLEDGPEKNCAELVNAAGPWAGQVAALAGVALPVEPGKRMTYVFRCPDDLSHIPLTIDISGLAF